MRKYHLLQTLHWKTIQCITDHRRRPVQSWSKQRKNSNQSPSVRPRSALRPYSDTITNKVPLFGSWPKTRLSGAKQNCSRIKVIAGIQIYRLGGPQKTSIAFEFVDIAWLECKRKEALKSPLLLKWRYAWRNPLSDRHIRKLSAWTGKFRALAQ
jgi:hypothetical protein